MFCMRQESKKMNLQWMPASLMAEAMSATSICGPLLEESLLVPVSMPKELTVGEVLNSEV